ncbi:hypothetical protein PHISP_04911 [Aspergillus sp. HF37]|nr:hypothetical protein PHISP_04911 [Aspergillus sp. HF37]
MESQTTVPQSTATDPSRTFRTKLVEGSGSKVSMSMPDNPRAILEKFHEGNPLRRKPDCCSAGHRQSERNWKIFDRSGEEVRVSQFKVMVTKPRKSTYYVWVVYPKSEPPKLVGTAKVGSHRTYYLGWLGHDAGFEEKYCAVRIWKNKGVDITYDPNIWKTAPKFSTQRCAHQTVLSKNDLLDPDSSMDVDEHKPHSSPPYELRSKRRSLVAASDSDDGAECERSGPVTRSSRKRPVEQRGSLIVTLRGPKISRLLRRFNASEIDDGEQLNDGNGHECNFVENSVDRPGSSRTGSDGRPDQQDEQESEGTDCSSDAGVSQDNGPETQRTVIQEQVAEEEDGMELCETGESDSCSEGESDSSESDSEESDDSSSEGEASEEEVEVPTNGVSGAAAGAVRNDGNNENDGNNANNANNNGNNGNDQNNGPATPISTGNGAHPDDNHSSMTVQAPQLTTIILEDSSSPSNRDSSIHGTGATSRNFTTPASMSSSQNHGAQVTGGGSQTNLPTPTPTTVDRSVRFILIGRPDFSTDFTLRSQHPGAELFAKAEEYFKMQAVNVLYCSSSIENSTKLLTKNCLRDVDYCITQWERCVRLNGGGAVFVNREPFDF